MVGRDLDHRFPERAPPTIGEVGLRHRGLDRAPSDRPAAQGRRRGLAQRPARRDRGHRRADGRRPHRAGDERVRPLLRPAASAAGSTCDGEEIRTRTVPEAIGHGIAYVTEDRKHYGLNLIDDISRNISLAPSSKVSPARRGQRARGDRSPSASGDDEHQGADGLRDHGQAQRRQPAEGRPQQVDLRRAGGAHPRRADPRASTSGPSTRSTRSSTTWRPRARPSSSSPPNCRELLGMCDRIYTMAAGRLTGEVPARERDPGSPDAPHDHGPRELRWAAR